MPTPLRCRLPRLARRVAPGIPHHNTQRGTNRQLAFLTQRNRRVYLDLLCATAEPAGVRILAYCLMPNHIHLVAGPEEPGSFAVALWRTHGRYPQCFNARKLRSGHLWQNRFFSCAMHRAHLWAALRYVERNPVRAGLVERPGEFAWSSTAAHLGEKDRFRILDLEFWQEVGGLSVWQDLLDQPEDSDALKQIRRATHAGQPLGDEEFKRQVALLSCGAISEEGAGEQQIEAAQFDIDGATVTLVTSGV